MRARTVAALVATLGLVLPAAPAAAAPDGRCAEPGKAIAGVPWPQQRQPPQAIWPVADGSGARVAVLASGVDADHPQLAGRVRDGQNYLDGDAIAADADCEGLGTQVAGVIAAAPQPGVGFTGLARDATIVPYRVAAAATLQDGSDAATGTPGTIARAVRDATGARPDVIVIPVVTYVDDADLRSAVAAAVADDIVVVASVGDGRTSGEGPTKPYPAAYDGVVGVGAVGPDGSLGGDPGSRGVTDLVAPGGALVSTQVGGGLTEAGGSAIASGYVAGTVALIRSRWPDLKAPDVVRRLLATATPLGDGAGRGLVGPAQAVTETLTTASPRPLTGADDRAPQATADDTTTLALAIAGGVAVLALLGVGFALAIPRGRARRWRPGLAPRPEEHPEDDAPAPPRLLFEDWTPGGH